MVTTRKTGGKVNQLESQKFLIVHEKQTHKTKDRNYVDE